MAKIKFGMLAFLILFFPLGIPQAMADVPRQQPTLDIATVTGTPTGSIIRVTVDNDQINVRSGPHTTYPEVGILIAGEEVAAIGISIGQDWIQIEYHGADRGKAWVYADLVLFIKGNLTSLPIVEAPPTPTPQSTPTIDPTLAAQFIQDVVPTGLPTFTPPPPLVIVTHVPATSGGGNQFPIGIVILALFILGLGGGLLSILRRR